MIRAHLAVSVDCYIADAQGSVGWLDAFSGEGLGYTEFAASISTIVSGRATFDQALGFVAVARTSTSRRTATFRSDFSSEGYLSG
jgi:dihydrofolate reductase